MNESSFLDLQIFCPTSQLSGSRAGSWNKKREGFSIFRQGTENPKTPMRKVLRIRKYFFQIRIRGSVILIL
jgi:hypothetical protein